MRHDDPIGKQRGDRFVHTVAILCFGGLAMLVAVVAYTVWTGLA